ncbi:MAG: YwaF family protein [Clostridia bacterium]|nr:YwaF family protein [Clostridia bacterium]MBQ9798238.1 YwaF family protein [Clostridia bacterium]
MKEFFGWDGYAREPEGFMSLEHILFVTALMAIMACLAIVLGRRNRHADERQKNRVLVTAAILIDSFELFKIVLLCFRGKDPWAWLYTLPLFMCSILLIAIPLAAFSKGRVREAALDFVLIFGLLGAVLGTYGAGNNYGSYPVLSFDNVVSGITHSISGFSSLYIGISGMASLKRKNLPITFAVLLGFAVCAMIANGLLDYNYMFLVRGDGTPYDILYNLVGGHPILYPMGVILLFLLYIAAFYGVYYLIHARAGRKTSPVKTA